MRKPHEPAFYKNIPTPSAKVAAPNLNTHSVAWIVCDAALYGERGGEVVRLSDRVPCRIRWQASPRNAAGQTGEILLDREISLKATDAGHHGRIRISLPRKRQYYIDHFLTPAPLPGETAILRPGR